MAELTVKIDASSFKEEFEQIALEIDGVVAQNLILKDMANEHRKMFLDDGYLHEAVQITEFLEKTPSQSLAFHDARVIEKFVTELFGENPKFDI
jgi:hypothetical protein